MGEIFIFVFPLTPLCQFESQERMRQFLADVREVTRTLRGSLPPAMQADEDNALAYERDDTMHRGGAAGAAGGSGSGGGAGGNGGAPVTMQSRDVSISVTAGPSVIDESTINHSTLDSTFVSPSRHAALARSESFSAAGHLPEEEVRGR